MADAFPEHLARLLTSSIETQERLDVLCLLKRSRPRTFTAKSVATELSIPTSRAETALAMLCGRGFLTVNIANDLGRRVACGNRIVEIGEGSDGATIEVGGGELVHDQRSERTCFRYSTEDELRLDDSQAAEASFFDETVCKKDLASICKGRDGFFESVKPQHRRARTVGSANGF